MSGANVRYWHKADIGLVALHMSAFGGKADMRHRGHPNPIDHLRLARSRTRP